MSATSLHLQLLIHRCTYTGPFWNPSFAQREADAELKAAGLLQDGGAYDGLIGTDKGHDMVSAFMQTLTDAITPPPVETDPQADEGAMGTSSLAGGGDRCPLCEHDPHQGRCDHWQIENTGDVQCLCEGAVGAEQMEMMA